MLEPRILRDQAAVVKAMLKKRQMPDKQQLVDEWIAADKEWRELKGETDALRARRNKVSEDINAAKKAKKPAPKKKALGSIKTGTDGSTSWEVGS